METPRKWRDFDGILGTGLPVSMYTTKTPIDKCRFIVTQLKEFFTFSVKDRYLPHCLSDNRNISRQVIVFLS
jgi:hypothetical protein